MSLDPADPSTTPPGGHAPDDAGPSVTILDQLPTPEQVPELLRTMASIDLELDGVVTPQLFAFARGAPLAAIGLRPFASGDAVRALIEVLSFLLPVGADRVLCSFGGRAWSSADPVPPVCEAGDLRVPVLVIVDADASSGTCALTSSLATCEESFTFREVDGLREGEAVEGEVPWVLRTLLDQRHAVTARPDELLAQVGRVMSLGHDVRLSSLARTRLRLTTTPA